MSLSFMARFEVELFVLHWLRMHCSIIIVIVVVIIIIIIIIIIINLFIFCYEYSPLLPPRTTCEDRGCPLHISSAI